MSVIANNCLRRLLVVLALATPLPGLSGCTEQNREGDVYVKELDARMKQIEKDANDIGTKKDSERK
jgi:hypothetical protein